MFDSSRAAGLTYRDEVARRDGFARWLEVYEVAGWRAATEATGIHGSDITRWLRRHAEFRAAFDAARESTATRLEAVVDEIATGERDATSQQVQMLMFRLRGLRPDVYRERSSVSVDATTRTEGGEGGRARLLLAEWST